jgi:protein-S-isoprenylcysteine O-methyltransferase Ste14
MRHRRIWSFRPPALGPRGEGWVAIQLLLYGAVGAAGLLGPSWPTDSRLRRLGALALAVGGTAMMVRGAVALGRSLTPNPMPRDGRELREEGIYAVIRHPIYGGVILSALGWSLWLSPAALVPTAATGAFLDLKSRREEMWLVERYSRYRDYRARVRNRFLPLVW